MIRVSREQVISYRLAAQQFGRQVRSASELAVLDIGLQDSVPGGAQLALAARLAPQPGAGAGLEPGAARAEPARTGPGERFALCWTLRGAPHLHRRDDLDRLGGALWPLSDADAAVRLGVTGRAIARAGQSALELLALAVEAMHVAVPGPTGKGEVSAAMTRQLPAVLTKDCRACRTRHVSDPTMRLAALAAGTEFEPLTAPPVLVPRAGAVTPAHTDRAALRELICDYLRLLGPATVTEVAGYLDARRADIEEVWPTGLVEVDADGRRAQLAAGCLDSLTSARRPELVRLLSPFDPYLQARDREVIVPDAGIRKVLWPVLGRPGVVLVDGEVAGIWRPRASGKRLTVTVDAFTSLAPTAWRTITDEAQLVGAARGVADVQLVRGS
ncbi:MAG TPA: crosslink repair DNA glycosylase YcaQ family protein [Jatrophihabitantaceae bacterium]|nr:crosslink repair DNA glycosylase YcaQ family protein [Jatrophihabitantaceae bacterium]